jgi:hypothetical protein
MPSPTKRTAPLHARRQAADDAKAIALEMRKAIEPNRSGARMRRSSYCTERLAMRAASVRTLKNKVSIG